MENTWKAKLFLMCYSFKGLFLLTLPFIHLHKGGTCRWTMAYVRDCQRSYEAQWDTCKWLFELSKKLHKKHCLATDDMNYTKGGYSELTKCIIACLEKITLSGWYPWSLIALFQEIGNIRMGGDTPKDHKKWYKDWKGSSPEFALLTGYFPAFGPMGKAVQLLGHVVL